MPTKVCSGFFLFCLDFKLYAKSEKDLVFAHVCTLMDTRFLIFLLITQDLKKIKKNPKHYFVYIAKSETCANIKKKIL